MDKGTYILLVYLPSNVEITRPKSMELKKGYYAYVGSAMNSLTGRLKRHLLKDKKIHWHVDQLTSRGRVIFFAGFVGCRLEEELSEFLSKELDVIEKFGSSDLRTKGNLFHVKNPKQILEALARFSEKYSCNPQ
jgi:Uri superfamily endonuclease